MTFIKEVIESSMDIWEKYLIHPFTTGIVKGTVDEELFKNYIIEDTIYLKEYARIFACGMYKSETLKDIRMFYSVLGFIESNENATRERYVAQFGLTDDWIDAQIPRVANKNYTDFMHKVSKEGDTLEILMAVLPCVFTYYYIFDGLMKESEIDLEQHPYGEFLKDYAGEGYLGYCKEWGSYANELAVNVSEERKEVLKQIFREASQHEMNFWDMANTPVV